MKIIYDINKQKIEIGDLVLYNSYSKLYKGYVLRFLKNGISVSTKRSKPHSFNIPTNDLEEHNSSIVVPYWKDFLIIKKHADFPKDFPEGLLKFYKR